MRKLKIAVLGATGSIGRQTLDVIRNLSDRFEVEMLANDSDRAGLDILRAEFPTAKAYCFKQGLYFSDASDSGKAIPNYLGDAETYREIDVVVNGIAGIAGIAPSSAALKAGKTLATANKESLVCFGDHLKAEEREYGGKILPVDSEHSAILQCVGEQRDFSSLTITASGGAFRDLPYDRLSDAKASDALQHPNWSMGEKITIDCATMVNKAFELKEAACLFETTDVDAVLHRESVVHALVAYPDGSVKASLGTPDMRIPIQYALTYPKRFKCPAKPLEIAKLGGLTFSQIDERRYPAYAVLKNLKTAGEGAGCAAVSADEVLVGLYRRNAIGYFEIAELLEKTMTRFQHEKISSIDDVYRMEREIRAYITSMTGRMSNC